jgi:UDP-N-acetylmuramoyl-L-alanyl-D-glutamate--2,6-diaminopimelate ligase
MRLERLLAGIDLQFDRASGIEVSGLTLDSRKVTDGALFVAIKGSVGHGMDYVDAAILAGASAVIYDDWDGEIPKIIPALHIPGLMHKVGHIAHAFYGNPCSAMQIIGVTGTNGKTTTVHLIAQLAEYLGIKAARIGTLGVSVGADKLIESDRTTPDAITLASMFAELRSRDVNFVAMEVSSHALDQGRVDGIPFTVGVITNLTRDHLDYHQTMEAYGAAKARLFHDFALRAAIFNIDDSFCRKLSETTSQFNVVNYGSDADHVDIQLIRPTDSGSNIRVSIHSVAYDLQTSLLGAFNASNVMAAFAAISALFPDDVDRLLAAIPKLQAAPGRMEWFRAPEFATVVVDYAHTPDALENAIKTCKAHCVGEVWSVFGCGGDRDVGKRPLMGQVASELSDHIVLTSDNPRSESPQHILNDIRAGMTKPPILEELDRAAAIRFAVEHASADDWVLLAGKGHENTQTIGQKTVVYSDRAEVARLFGLMGSEVQHAS